MLFPNLRRLPAQHYGHTCFKKKKVSSSPRGFECEAYLATKQEIPSKYVKIH